jgi:hypothetical protein
MSLFPVAVERVHVDLCLVYLHHTMADETPRAMGRASRQRRGFIKESPGPGQLGIS